MVHFQWGWEGKTDLTLIDAQSILLKPQSTIVKYPCDFAELRSKTELLTRDNLNCRLATINKSTPK